MIGHRWPVILVSVLGFFSSIYEWLAASMKASALIGVTVPVAGDYLNHLRHESWFALFAAGAFVFIFIYSIIRRSG